MMESKFIRGLLAACLTAIAGTVLAQQDVVSFHAHRIHRKVLLGRVCLHPAGSNIETAAV